MVKDVLRMRVGCGEKIFFLSNKWIGSFVLKEFYFWLYFLVMNKEVLIKDLGIWDDS